MPLGSPTTRPRRMTSLRTAVAFREARRPSTLPALDTTPRSSFWTVRGHPAGGCGPAPASGIQPSGMHPQPGPGRARVRRRRPARRRVCHGRGPVRTPVACARAAAHRRAVSGHCRPRPRAGAGGPCPLTRWCVARGGEVMRCAGRRDRPRGAAGGLAPPAPVAPDRRPVGHRQARVENAFFRYKSMLGDRLRRRTRAAQAVESVRACNVLNRMTALGRPESCAIDR